MRYLTALLSLALVGTVTACGADSTGPSDSYSGTYALRTINGQSLPYILLQVGPDKVEWTQDALTVTDNGTTGGSFTQQSTLRVTASGQVTTQNVSDAGVYTRNGTAVILTANSDGTIATGTISGGRMTLSLVDAGVPFSLVYQK